MTFVSKQAIQKGSAVSRGLHSSYAVLASLRTVLLKGHQMHSRLLERYALASLSVTYGRGLSATAPLTFVELPVLCT